MALIFVIQVESFVNKLRISSSFHISFWHENCHKSGYILVFRFFVWIYCNNCLQNNEFQTIFQVMASYVLLSDNEVKEKFAIMEARRQRIMEKKMRAELGDGQGQNLEELSMKLAEARMQKRNEQQGTSL